MIRFVTSAIAAAVLTTGAVAALADTPDATPTKVRVAANGDYCVTMPAVTGSYIQSETCKSQANWSAEGVNFAHR